jgi:hypothetical protein
VEGEQRSVKHVQMEVKCCSAEWSTAWQRHKPDNPKEPLRCLLRGNERRNNESAKRRRTARSGGYNGRRIRRRRTHQDEERDRNVKKPVNIARIEEGGGVGDENDRWSEFAVNEGQLVRKAINNVNT